MDVMSYSWPHVRVGELIPLPFWPKLSSNIMECNKHYLHLHQSPLWQIAVR